MLDRPAARYSHTFATQPSATSSMNLAVTDVAKTFGIEPTTIPPKLLASFAIVRTRILDADETLIGVLPKLPLTDGEGFEPPVPFGTVVFKTTAIVHSATHPLLTDVKFTNRQPMHRPPSSG